MLKVSNTSWGEIEGEWQEKLKKKTIPAVIGKINNQGEYWKGGGRV